MEINFEISWWYMVHGSFLNDLVFVYLCISVFVYLCISVLVYLY